MQIRLRSILLALGMLLIGVHLLVPISSDVQIAVMLLFLLAFGIPHGALDYYVDRRFSDASPSGHALLFLSKYFLNMGLYAIIWYFFPTLALLLFILITAYHFGEIDWMGRVNSPYHRVFYFILGLGWIVFLLCRHMDEAVSIFILMGQSRYTADAYLTIAKKLLPVSFIVLWVLHAVLLVFNRTFFKSNKEFLFSILQILMLSLINIFLPLWLCFAFYFGLWHSLLSFDVIRGQLAISGDLNGWKKLLLKSIPYSLLAWAGLLVFMKYRLFEMEMAHVFQLLFIGIAVLTLPHLQVFTKLKVDPRSS